MEKNNELVKVIIESGVEQSTASVLKEKFLPFFDQAEAWEAKAKMLVVTDVKQIREMKMAREARLALKEIRVNADKTRKTLKEDSLRYGKAVQGVYNVIEYLIAPIEKHLEQQEKFAEIQEQKRIDALREKRSSDVEQYAEFMPAGIDLGWMSEVDYEKLVDFLKARYQDKIEAEQREARERELDRIEQSRRNKIAPFAQFILKAPDLRNMTDQGFADLAKEVQKAKADYDTEQERVRQENVRLQKAKEEAELKAAQERKAAEAKIKAEQESARKAAEAAAVERAKLEAQIKAKEEAELKVKEEAEKAAKAAASAPDKDKLTQLAIMISTTTLPECSTEAGRSIVKQVDSLLAKVILFIHEKTKEI